MALQRISKQKKEAYNLVIKEYKDRIETTLKKIKKFEREGMAENSVNGYYKRVATANLYLNTVGLYCEMSEKSMEILSMKNDAYLGDARKNIYQAIKLIESFVGSQIDSSLTDNSDVLQSLTLLNPRRVSNLLKKFDYDITLVEFAEGENSRFKWNFVELYGKFVALAKNVIDFKTYAQGMNNPMTDYYQEINEVLTLVKSGCDNAAQKYRTKYELSTMDVADMNIALDFMNLLVRIHIILNEQEFAQSAKKTIEKWKAKLEQDLKKKEEEAKKKQQIAAKKKKRGFFG